ncbi:pyrophosphatase PpaX [soil metagenome]
MAHKHGIAQGNGKVGHTVAPARRKIRRVHAFIVRGFLQRVCRMFTQPLPSILLFDLDGTLIDTYHLYLESYRRALAPHLGRAPTQAEIIARRPSLERRFLAEWIGEEQANACHATMREHYTALHGALGEGVYPGVPEMLAALRSAGYRLGIVTGKGRSTWEVSRPLLYQTEWEVVITDDDVRTPKPDPEGILLALRQMGAEAGDAVYVGDSVTDLDAGRRAGTRVAAALWPKTASGEREEFLARAARFTPEWLWEQPADLTRSLAGWC